MSNSSLAKIDEYLSFQNPFSFKRVLGHFWYLMGQIEKKTIFKFIYNTKRLKFCKLCFYRPKYLRGICLIVRLRKLMIYLLFQNPFSFKWVLGHFWYLLGQTEEKSSFEFIYNTKRLKFFMLCFYRPKYRRGISARSIGILRLRKLMYILVFWKACIFQTSSGPLLVLAGPKWD